MHKGGKSRMRKSFIICLALVLTFFTMPFGGMTAMADGKAFDDIEDGEYEITAKALHADKDEASGAAGFIEEDAILSIQDGEVELTITIPHNDMAEIEGLQIEGNAPITQDEGTGNWTYKLDTLKPELVSQVQYAVPSIGMEHDVPFRFMLEGLDELPVKEEEPETPEEPEDEPEDNGDENGSEDESGNDESEDTGDDENGSENENGNDESEDADDENGSEDENGNDESEDADDENGSENENGNDESEDTGDGNGSENENGDDESEDTGDENGSEDENGNDESEDPEDEDESENGENGSDSENPEETELDAKNLVEVGYSLEYTFLKKGEDAASSMDGFTDGPAYVKVDEDGNQFVALTLTSAEMIQWFKVNDEYATVLQEDKNTRVVEFKVDNLTEKQDGNIYVEVPNMYSTEHEVDLVFDTNSLQTAKDSDYPEDHNIGQSPKPVNPEGEGNDDLGKPSGDDNDEKPGTLYEKSELIPDKAYEIDFVIKHETEDRISAADEFFKKPGILLYKDGEKYLQLTVTNSDMIQSLSAGGKDVLIVQENADGSKVIQFKVAGAISDVIDLNMFISVPGLYDMEHNARLFLDPDSQKEVGVGDYLLVAGSENNLNGPLVENGDSGGTIGEKTPKKPDRKSTRLNSSHVAISYAD